MTTPARDQLETLRELWLTDTDLTFLTDLPPDTLSRIVHEVEAHHQRTSASQRRLYETIARTTRLIPNFMVVKLGAGLGPYVQARICEYLEPKAAAALSKAFEPSVVAEISLHLEAGLAAQIAAHTDIDTLEKITDLLHERGFARRLGEISDALDERVLEKLVQRTREPARIAAVAAHMTDYAKMGTVMRRLDARVMRTVVSLLEQQGQTRAVHAITG